MTHVVDSPPFCWSQQTAVPPKWADRQRRCMMTRRNALPTQTVDSTHCRHRPSILPADATHCRCDPVPTRTVDDQCDTLQTKKMINAVNPLTCWWSLTITVVSHRRWMIFSDLQLHPTAYWLVWSNQNFLRTDFINISVSCPVHTYAASNPFIFFSSLFRCCWLT